MDLQSRQERLVVDRESLASLAAGSTIFSFEASGEPPDRYTLTFRGKGLARDTTASSEVVIVELHQIDLRLPYSYPNSPPDIRWITPLWHPAVSFSGFVNLADVGLAWTKDVPLDVVCERLWDVARAAFVQPSRATNYAAKNWFEKECPFPLPVDSRPLRDRAAELLCDWAAAPLRDRGAASGSNIVHYQRRAGQAMQFVGAPGSGEVMFIDENTPTPALPERRPYVPASRRAGNDEDVIYIGPE